MLNILAIRKAILFIENNFQKRLTLTDVAGESGMSKYHFARTFKIMTGRTFKGYLNEIRIEKARTLLKGGELTVTEICYAVGFNDLSYFDRVFHKLEGANPLAYQKMHCPPRPGWIVGNLHVPE